jgi:hypothetical protein
MAEMPRYRCHKVVRAVRILKISNPSTDHSMTIIPSDDVAPFKVRGEYVNKHRPYVGGFYTLADDGEEGYAHPNAFERGYSLVETPTELPLGPQPGELVIGEGGAQLLAVRMIHGPAILLRMDDIIEALKVSEPTIHEPLPEVGFKWVGEPQPINPAPGPRLPPDAQLAQAAPGHEKPPAPAPEPAPAPQPPPTLPPEPAKEPVSEKEPALAEAPTPPAA